MSYAVKEIFYTLQGEGSQAGRPAVFCRFTGCNLWTGREDDRATAVCKFCDTDFVGMDGTGGGRFANATQLAQAIGDHWPDPVQGRPFVVLTGGEPLLQVDRALVEQLHAIGFEIAVETNGTQIPPDGLDWICVSPKAGADLVLRHGNEMKLVYPQAGADPALFCDLAFDRFHLQPMDGPDQASNIKAAIAYVMAHPKWHLSLQTHKLTGIR